MPSFSARSFTEMPSVMVMFPRDRRRLVADDHARRRSVALHRAFLHASRHISLSRPPRRSSRTASRTRWSRRAPFPLPDLRPADAIPLAQRASDASAAVLPDEAADAAIPALADAPSAEKLAVPEPAVLARSGSGAPGGGTGALYTGRGPVCGMIIRGCGVAGIGGRGGSASSLKIDGRRGRLGRGMVVTAGGRIC